MSSAPAPGTILSASAGTDSYAFMQLIFQIKDNLKIQHLGSKHYIFFENVMNFSC